MQSTWSYKNYKIEEGLKPGSKSFRYFFRVLEGEDKKFNCCVWITDEALSKFDPGKEFGAIVTSQKDSWQQWLKGKIDGGDFRNRALRIEKDSQVEIDLSEMKDQIKPG